MNEKFIFGATIDSVKSIAWFNAKFPHSLPLSLNTLNRAILKQLAGNDYNISLTNKPFDLRMENESLEDAKNRRASQKLVQIPIVCKFLFCRKEAHSHRIFFPKSSCFSWWHHFGPQFSSHFTSRKENVAQNFCSLSAGWTNLSTGSHLIFLTSQSFSSSSVFYWPKLRSMNVTSLALLRIYRSFF